MESITNGVEIRKGGLGYIVKGQKGKWYGSPPPKRQGGDITKFSNKSRKRLREMLAIARPKDRRAKPFGITLTIPGRILTPDEVRALWDVFQQNVLRREFPLPVIWRIELQKRKQAHWHCVVWASKSGKLPPVVVVYNLAAAWRRIVMHKFSADWSERTLHGFIEHGVEVKSLDGASETGIVGYLADHTSKHKQEQLGWQGRQWGIVNRSKLTFETKTLALVDERQHIQATRQFRRLQNALRTRGGSYTGVRVSPSSNVSTAVFGNDADRLLKCYRFYSRL